MCHDGAKGRREMALLISDLGTSWGVSGQRHALAVLYLQGKDHQNPLNRRPSGP
jgi:hypothetical protein